MQARVYTTRFYAPNSKFQSATPNSKFQSATKDREMHERDELSQRKYSRRRLLGQDIASLVAKV